MDVLDALVQVGAHGSDPTGMKTDRLVVWNGHIRDLADLRALWNEIANAFDRLAVAPIRARFDIHSRQGCGGGGGRVGGRVGGSGGVGRRGSFGGKDVAHHLRDGVAAQDEQGNDTGSQQTGKRAVFHYNEPSYDVRCNDYGMKRIQRKFGKGKRFAGGNRLFHDIFTLKKSPGALQRERFSEMLR